MKIALLGSDPELPPLAFAAIEMGHTIVQAVDVGTVASEVAKIAPDAEQHATWESLLDPAAVDAVFVGRAADDERRRTEQLRHLANEGIPLLLIHPVVQSMLMHHELAMIARDTRGVLFPYVPNDGHPAFAQLASFIAPQDTPEEIIENVSFERHLTNRERAAVTAAFARDAYLLRTLFPGVNKLSAVGVNDSADSYAGLTVHLTGPEAPPIRWAVAPAKACAAQLTLQSARRIVTLSLPDDDSPPRMKVDEDQSSQELELEEFDSHQTAVEQFVKGIQSPNDSSDYWRRAVQSMDLTDAIEMSIEKGRAVEVQMQDDTEQVAFRARMTTFGCRFLLFLPLLIIAIGLVGDALKVPFTRYWPVVLLAVLVVFLLIQFAPRLLAENME